MSDTQPDLSRLVADLTRTVEELRDELEAETRPRLRPPTPGELARFTSEVTIPALVLALETNVRLLKLFQRALRLADGREPTDSGSVSEVQSRVESVGRATLSRLDDVLADLQEAVEGRPPDDEARDLLADARDLSRQTERRLDDAAGEGPEPGEEGSVDIDVESELQSLKDQVDDGDDDRDDT